MKIIRTLLIFSVLLCVRSLLYPEIRYQLILQPESRLWIEGDSTLHAFEAEAEKKILAGAAVIKDEQQLLNKRPAEQVLAGSLLEDFTLTIPVDTMKSGVPGLTGRMRKCLKQKESPDIIFTLRNFSVQKDNPAGDTYLVKAAGALLIAKVTREESLEFSASLLPDGNISVQGEKQLLMTDFGMTPPSIIGLLKTKDEVAVKWQLIIEIK